MNKGVKEDRAYLPMNATSSFMAQPGRKRGEGNAEEDGLGEEASAWRRTRW
jgi:hypothetical protein